MASVISARIVRAAAPGTPPDAALERAFRSRRSGGGTRTLRGGESGRLGQSKPHPQAQADEDGWRATLLKHLSTFKVPRRFVPLTDLGAEVSLLQGQGQILTREDRDAAECVEEAMIRDGVHLRLGAKIERVEVNDG